MKKFIIGTVVGMVALAGVVVSTPQEATAQTQSTTQVLVNVSIVSTQPVTLVDLCYRGRLTIQVTPRMASMLVASGSTLGACP